MGPGFDPWVGQISWRRERLPTPVFWSSEYIHWGFPDGASSKESTCQCRRCKRCGFDLWIREDPLEEEMATYSSILAGEMPWTEEPGGLQSMESESRTWLSTSTANTTYIHCGKQKIQIHIRTHLLTVSSPNNNHCYKFVYILLSFTYGKGKEIKRYFIIHVSF